MSVHVHSEGGGATHFMLGCIEDAEKITGDKDQRNVLAHLHFVTDEDIRRMAETGSIEFGKLANMTVFDCDFLHDDIEKVAQANVIATIVDGEEVYKA